MRIACRSRCFYLSIRLKILSRTMIATGGIRINSSNTIMAHSTSPAFRSVYRIRQEGGFPLPSCNVFVYSNSNAPVYSW